MGKLKNGFVKKVLITGGAGYLGSHLVRDLLDHNHEVTVYSRDELKHFNLKLQLREQATRVKFVIGDVRDKEQIISASEGMDIIIHAAALKQVGVCEENPGECFKTNINGTENVIEACSRNHVGKLIFISTDKAVEPMSVYGNSKQAGERLALKANNSSFRSSVIRFGNLIGSPGSIVDKVSKMREDEVLTIYSRELTRFQDSVDFAVELIGKQINEDFGGTIMLPKLTSVYIHQLIAQQFPTIDIEIGEEQTFEKTHEKLATPSELARSVMNQDYYLVTPNEFSVNEALDRYGCIPSDVASYTSLDVLVSTASEQQLHKES